MNRIRIVAVGKIKEKYLTEGIREFAKRLGPLCKLEVVEIDEERMPDDPSPAEKEKVLAAHRVGIRTIIMPERNRDDIDDIPEELRDEITFIPVDNVKQVLDAALRRVATEPAVIVDHDQIDEAQPNVVLGEIQTLDEVTAQEQR